MTGDWVSGPLELTEEQLGANRRNFYEDCLEHKLDTADYWQSRMPDWSKVKVPLLSTANWGGQGLHPRGNFEGFVRAASKQKWLEAHGLEHWTHFYTDYGVALQKRFFGHFLKGQKTGWDKQPKVQLQVRHVDKFVERHEKEWPLKRTKWTKFFLDPADLHDVDKAAVEEIAGHLQRLRRRRDLPDRAVEEGHRDHRPDRGEALGLVGDRGRRPVPGGAGVLARHEGIGVPGRARSAHAVGTRLAAGVAPKARQEAHPALPAVSHPRRRAEAQEERGGRSATSRSGRPASWCRPAIRLALTVRGKDYVYPGGAGGGLKTLGNFTGVGPFRTTIRATGRPRCLAATSRCTRGRAEMPM